IKIDITRTNSKLTMIISDNGEGIKKEYLERVFDMFFRGTNNSIGTGLGLYICSEIVNKMKGEIGIESTYGQGTVITIELPIK
ncbi:MAG: sensor histidine kinase, partial [Bacteroidia bacterium]